ncbi:hypothetical protein [Mycobacterium riyadhense]|uniref:hypothetical protein n=1 Tax=Mycobacterium riyadhense TaxID=486698 RepID=UPI0019576206|nr:hypothetical protein [Mycobacterium riyadhense]
MTTSPPNNAELEQKCRDRISRPNLQQALIDIINNRQPALDNETDYRFEETENAAESAAYRYLNSAAARKVRWLSSVDIGDTWIAKVIETAIGEEHGFYAGPDVGPGDLIAIRQRRAWKITEETTLEDVIKQIKDTTLEPECDMEFHAGTAFGSCMEDHITMINSLHKLDQDPYLVGKDGLPNPYRRKYLEENFHTVPFARGNTVVLARLCKRCVNGFAASNQIDINKLGTVEPKPSGFGTIGTGPIEKSEYAWDQDAIRSVAQEWELRNGRPPSLVELQKALQGAGFIGEGSGNASVP